MKKGWEGLKESVIERGLCTACGACVGICPYIKTIRDRIAIIESCGLPEGRCYDFCPRTPTDFLSLDKRVFGEERSDFSLGPNKEIFLARAMDEEVRTRSQYGGTVSSLLIHALESGFIEGAVLTSEDSKPFLATDREGILRCAGTKYTACPTLSGVNAAKEIEKLGFVGTPCQVIAARKMGLCEDGKKIELIIGLFCMWSLSYDDFYSYLKEKIDLSSIRKLDIPVDGFVIYTERETKKFPLEDVKQFIRPACNICFDMTSEYADISVGSVEGIEDWNTVIVRTIKGEKLIEKAKKDGIIETRAIEPERLEHLREASLNKKKKALNECGNDIYFREYLSGLVR
ncbi:MAG: Coenzyme F420 hydrogenase/dehydrogenase, beta subunit C-terminal domain [Candidatus Syntropharchaeia archaeon]